MTGRINDYFRIYKHWTAGRYWYGADIGQWPHRHLTVIEIIEDEAAKVKAEQAETKSQAGRYGL